MLSVVCLCVGIGNSYKTPTFEFVFLAAQSIHLHLAIVIFSRVHLDVYYIYVCWGDMLRHSTFYILQFYVYMELQKLDYTKKKKFKNIQFCLVFALLINVVGAFFSKLMHSMNFFEDLNSSLWKFFLFRE